VLRAQWHTKVWTTVPIWVFIVMEKTLAENFTHLSCVLR
jgi:hypothetical protein